MNWTIEDIKEANHRAGRYFFAPDTMRAFSSRVLDTVYQGAGGIYFITSEKDKHGTGGERLYTVRVFNPQTGDVRTAAMEFKQISKREAEKAALSLSRGTNQ